MKQHSIRMQRWFWAAAAVLGLLFGGLQARAGGSSSQLILQRQSAVDQNAPPRALPSAAGVTPQFFGSGPWVRGTPPVGSAPVIVANPTATSPAPAQNQTAPQSHVIILSGSGHERDFDHDRRFRHGHHDHDAVFFGGVWWPWWYSDGYVSSEMEGGPDYTDDTGAPPAANDQQTPQRPDYYQLGVEWAQDLRRDIVVWDQFVSYFRSYILTAMPTDEAAFRKGFLSAYGSNAEAAFDKAAEQAGEVIPQGPKIIYMGPQS